LARNLIGSPIIVIFHCTLPYALITRANLIHAVWILLEAYPILSHGVANTGLDRYKPAYRPISVQPEDVIDIVPLDIDLSHTQYIQRVNQEGRGWDIENGPLIRFRLYQSPKPEVRDRLIVFFDHIICDGIGGRNLLTELLCLLSEDSGEPLMAPAGLPIRIDESVDLFPNVGPAGGLVPNYPSSVEGYDPIIASQELSDISIPHAILEKLIAVGKAHSIPTLQPILHTASLLALYSASSSSTPLNTKTSTPISERDLSKGHPKSTGNYVIFHFSTQTIQPSTRFWDMARQYSLELRQPSTRINARAALGTLGRLPERGKEDGRSGWDDHLDELVKGVNGEVRLGMAISNVGRLELPRSGRLSLGIEDVYFAQSSSAVGAAIVLSVSDLTAHQLRTYAEYLADR
jgi:hypothetical protein